MHFIYLALHKITRALFIKLLADEEDEQINTVEHFIIRYIDLKPGILQWHEVYSQADLKVVEV